ncbi:MAG: hypothetical protein HY911_03935 [Desulfobacterales bacterium]|nr:hypothetical protein [Desulfobacterales bacterium]
MKTFLMLLVLCLSFAANAYADLQADGFDVAPLFKATKSFDMNDARLTGIRELVLSKFKENSSGSYTDGDTAYEETTYLDKDENSVKIATEKNTKTGAGKTTVTVTGPEAVVTAIRNKGK